MFGICGGFVWLSILKVPILSIECEKFVQMETVNVQDFGDTSLSQLESPVIFKGFGSSLAPLQAALQGFALNLGKEAKKQNGQPGRLMDDFSPGDATVLGKFVETMLTKKLSAPGRKRLVVFSAVPDEVSMPLVVECLQPILFGNVALFEGTMFEKRVSGSLRIAFSGRRTICAAPWASVLEAYAGTLTPMAEASVEPPTAKTVREWFRNLTEDRR